MTLFSTEILLLMPKSMLSMEESDAGPHTEEPHDGKHDQEAEQHTEGTGNGATTEEPHAQMNRRPMGRGTRHGRVTRDGGTGSGATTEEPHARMI